jgi:hypothetical protein
MPLVNRLLDAFFRTLDAVDTARERLDRVLGREPAMTPSAWEAAPEGATDAFTQRPAPTTWSETKIAPAKPPKAPAKATASAPAKKAAKDAQEAKPAKVTAKKTSKGAAKKSPRQKASRKGSVDRTGADFDSPRARAVLEQLVATSAPVIAEHAAIENKKVLARVVWALGAAQDAGSAQGLTAADASALLHLAAGMDVFSTNIARACREETDLIEEGEPDGRIKRYRLTAAGRKAAAALELRAQG